MRHAYVLMEREGGEGDERMIPPRFLYRKLGEKLTRFDERATTLGICTYLR